MKAYLGALLLLMLAIAGTPAKAVTFGLEPIDVQQLEDIPKQAAYRAFLPPNFDLSSKMPPVGDQGNVPACVAWSLVYAIQGFYERQRAAGATTLSPSFLYDNVSEPVGACTKGLNPFDALRFLKTVGSPSAADYPIKHDGCFPENGGDTPPQREMVKINSWTRLVNLDSVKGQLYLGNPVFVGMGVTEAFPFLKGPRIFSDIAGNYVGNHAMVIVGYDDAKSAFKIMNSWGEKWGDGGYGWVSYDVVSAQSKFFFAVAVVGGAPVKKADSPPMPVKPKPVAPDEGKTRITQGALDRAIEQWSSNSKCGVAKAILEKERIKITGVLGSQDDVQDLSNHIEKNFKQARIESSVVIKQWPACELYATMGAFEGRGLRVSSQPKTPRGGDEVSLKIAGPDIEGLLSVFYLQADGTAVVLEQDRPVRSKLDVDIGGTASKRLRVAPPYGDEGVIVLMSKKSGIVSVPKTGTEDRNFLTLLRLGLSKAQKDGNLIASGLLLLRTVP